MKISIVTVSFNQARYLPEAIESVVGQGYPELEYIVVDPGSTDGSRTLIESYGSAITQRIFEPDRGAADGLNKGFARATGDVYGFLNADDVLYPGALQAVGEYFTKHPECDIAFGCGHKIDATGKRLRHFCSGHFSVNRYFYGGAVWLQQATFFRAEAFHRSLRFNVGNRTCWDGELFVVMVNSGARVRYLRKDLAGFRIHGASISGSGRLGEQYRQDSRRIFRQVKGREWNRMDDARRIVYRVTSYLSRIGNRWMT